jgi:hypothetical protein
MDTQLGLDLVCKFPTANGFPNLGLKSVNKEIFNYVKTHREYTLKLKHKGKTSEVGESGRGRDGDGNN